MENQHRELGLMGIDQLGDIYHLQTMHPRKELLGILGRKHAAKMYRDTRGGKIRHEGYIIAGRWINIYRVSEWKEAE
jgi:hypothetical protein